MVKRLSNRCKSHWLKRVLQFVGLLLILFVAVVAYFSVSIYRANIGGRQESFEPLMMQVEDFKGLERTEMPFASNKKQQLMGYLYQKGTNQKGVIILSHGFGDGGHNSYMDLADYFAENGYFVFTYDATGTDKSAGAGVGGFPQGPIDLEYAIQFIRTQDNLKDLPLMVFGHSWGAYSAGNVLNYVPDVKAVISVAGFNRSSDVFEVVGRQEAGDGIQIMMPFINLYERLKFGNYAKSTSLDGFKNSDAKVMIVQSIDDDLVPMSYGYDQYITAFGKDDRFKFVLCDDRGHNHLFRDDNYIQGFIDDMKNHLDTMSFNDDEKDKEMREAAKTEYVKQNLDREKWTHSLDEEVVKQFIEFYDSAL